MYQKLTPEGELRGIALVVNICILPSPALKMICFLSLTYNKFGYSIIIRMVAMPGVMAWAASRIDPCPPKICNSGYRKWLVSGDCLIVKEPRLLVDGSANSSPRPNWAPVYKTQEFQERNVYIYVHRQAHTHTFGWSQKTPVCLCTDMDFQLEYISSSSNFTYVSPTAGYAVVIPRSRETCSTLLYSVTSLK